MSLKTLNGNAGPGHLQAVSRATEKLVRKLVAQTALSASNGDRVDPDKDGSDVLLACEVDGVRCVLVKAPAAQPEPVCLSPREQEIARMIAKGYPNKTIAAVLEISVWTVSTHLRRIFAKLHVSSRAAMVAKALDAERL